MRLSLIIGILFINISAFAQVNALFSVSQSSGCVPLVVTITNESTGTGTLTYNWNFGNGQTSTLQTPWSVNYINAGNFPLTLTVSNGTQTDTYSITIKVFADPTAQFSFTGDNQGCTPILLNFQDNSTPGSAPINSWNWEFGDGGFASTQNPSYSFNNPGTWSTMLEVTDTNGCSSTLVIDPVAIASNPIVSVVADQTSSCDPPLTVNFTNNTQGLNPMTYSWTFGDGGTSFLQNPNHTYTTQGVFDVTLTVTDDNGCTRSQTYPGMIQLSEVTAAFTTSTGSLSVCKNQTFQLINNSGNPQAYWTLGTGATSTQTSPWMIYNQPGTYSVTLISAPNTSCADTITQTITVVEFNADFTINPNSQYSCNNPSEYTFTYNGEPANSYQWTIETPNQPYVSNGVSSSYTYNTQGNYTISLIAISPLGCRDTATYEVVANPVRAIPEADTLEGCVPLDVNFTDNSYSTETITNWLWDFSDGQTSMQQHPTHTFNTAGEFWVSLTITNDSNCTHTDSILITAGYHHLPNFTICSIDHSLPLSQQDSCIFCPMDTIHFINLTTDINGNLIGSPNYTYPTNFPSGEQPEWSWFYGGSDFEPEEPLSSYFAQQDTGWQFNLWLVCDYLGCRDTVYLDTALVPDSVRLYINGPLIKDISSVMTCDSTYKRIFVTSIKDAHYWIWDFGDGTTYQQEVDDLVNPVFHDPASLNHIDSISHTYVDRGMYWVKVYAYNDSSGCIFKDSIEIRITDVEAILNPPLSNVCRYNSKPFSLIECQDHTWYEWTGNGGNSSSYCSYQYPVNFTPPAFNTLGDYPIQLIVKDEYGCSDTTEVMVHVTEPTIDFSADTTYGCSPLSVVFTSTSQSDMGILTSFWNYGDGQTGFGTSVNHTYTTNGNFNVTLTVTDNVGCTKTYTRPQYISTSNVNANFYSNDLRVCLGQPFSLTNTSMGNQLTYLWYFGNGDSSQVQNPIYTYPSSGFYDVTLIIQNNYECKDTLTVNHFFEVQEVNANFQISSTDTNCYPFRPHITNITPNQFLPQCNWNYGDGFVSTNYNPIHTYTLPGDFWISLHVSTSEGCTDKDSVLVHVGGPFGNISISDTLICKGDEVQFNLTDTMNITTVNWAFGGGYGSNDVNTSFIYENVPAGGFEIVNVVLESEDGSCRISSSDTIYIYQVIAGFNILNAEDSLPDIANCSPFNVTFPNTSQNASSWWWDLGNGNIYTGNTPSNINYTNPSPNDIIYTITQAISNDLGCVDTIQHTITVWGTPIITLSNDTLICLGDSAYIYAQGGTTINWSPNEGLVDSVGYQIISSHNTEIEYFAEISDHNGCKNQASVTVSVQQIPELYHSSDTTIIIGEIVNLFANSDQNNTQIIWSPNDWINCTTCNYPVSKPLENVTYTIVLKDSLGCFEIIENVSIEVIEAYSLDVPNVFTPNGDDANDLVYVRGWGIKNLLEFSIYNRWGQRIFFTDDLSQGWDGTFNGKPQNTETYSYVVKVQTYSEKIFEKKGNITLLR